MCKHVAAVLYGVGARFDHQPELLFRLREVDENELIVKAGKALPLAKQAPAAEKVLGSEDLSDIFGLDMAQSASADSGPAKKRAIAKTTKEKSAKQRAAKKKTAPKKSAPVNIRRPLKSPKK